MEIDGASNRGIDQIRELKEHVGLASFMGGSKVYILDEVHMLTPEAFNALLKTLEEPPPSVLFIFATTEPHKVPVTIRSRCQHIPFRRIRAESIVEQLRKVAETEKFDTEDSALWEIAREADGALRDALSLAEQAVALGNGALSLCAVQGLIGGSSRAELERFVSLLREDQSAASSLLKELLDRGVSPERFLDALFPLFRDMWVYSLWGESSFAGISLSEEEKNYLRGEAVEWEKERLRRIVSVCASLYPKTRTGLRSDVFSGLLLFELVGAFDERRRETAAASSRVSPETQIAPPEAKEHKMVLPLPQSPPKFKEAPPAPQPLETPTDGDSEIQRFFRGLWNNDLAVCAALIDAELSRDGEAIVIDSSQAGPLAKAILASPMARLAIERAFSEESKNHQPAAGPERDFMSEDIPKPTENKPGKTAAEMSAEELSIFLGAELLMSKPKNREDLSSDAPSEYEQTGDDI
jgi:DNA polymerase-3 subunit gamma/tau